MEKDDRPKPEHNGDSLEFWEGIKSHKILVQKCSSCGLLRFYPRIICPKCLSDQFNWIPCSGKGRIYSYTTIYRPPLPAFAEFVPYTIALIDLEEGIRILSQVEGNPDSIAIGVRVSVTFEDFLEKVALPKFRLADQ
jgi:uncharacterized OB-fold protein